MARFYDSMNDAELLRIEGLLKKNGIVYTLKVLGEGSTLKEIQVAEEDLTNAERALYGPSSPED